MVIITTAVNQEIWINKSGTTQNLQVPGEVVVGMHTRSIGPGKIASQHKRKTIKYTL